MQIFQRDRCIESLKFSLFLKELCLHLTKNNDGENSLINEFIRIIENIYTCESYKTKYYETAIRDHVFLKSKHLYIKKIKKFLDHKCSASQFGESFFYEILLSRRESEILLRDYKKQRDIKLDPINYGFSQMISNSDLFLEGYVKELDFSIPGSKILTENELYKTVENLLSKIENY